MKAVIEEGTKREDTGILVTREVDAMCEHIISLGTKLKAYEQLVDIETY